MTRKTKIGMAVAVAILGVVAAGFWLGEEQRPVSIICACVPAKDSNHVVITLTNRSMNYCWFVKWWLVDKDEAMTGSDTPMWGWQTGITGHSATNWEAQVRPGERWRIQIAYLEQTPDSMAKRTRAKLADGALGLGWGRIYEWMRPKEETRYIFSPEMLGSHPAPPEPK